MIPPLYYHEKDDGSIAIWDRPGEKLGFLGHIVSHISYVGEREYSLHCTTVDLCEPHLYSIAQKLSELNGDPHYDLLTLCRTFFAEQEIAHPEVIDQNMGIGNPDVIEFLKEIASIIGYSRRPNDAQN